MQLLKRHPWITALVLVFLVLPVFAGIADSVISSTGSSSSGSSSYGSTSSSSSGSSGSGVLSGLMTLLVLAAIAVGGFFLVRHLIRTRGLRGRGMDGQRDLQLAQREEYQAIEQVRRQAAWELEQLRTEKNQDFAARMRDVKEYRSREDGRWL